VRVRHGIWDDGTDGTCRAADDSGHRHVPRAAAAAADAARRGVVRRAAVTSL